MVGMEVNMFVKDGKPDTISGVHYGLILQLISPHLWKATRIV